LEIFNLIAVMKNIMKSLMLFAVAAMAFTSCAKEGVEEAVKPHDTFTMKFEAGTPDSRTSVEVDGTTATFSWAEEGETFTFVQNTSDGLKRGTDVTFANNGGLAEITATFTEATSPIVAIYPENAWVSDSNTNFNKAKLIVPNDQSILEGTFDPNADLLVSKVVTPETVTDTYLLQFARMVAIGKMTLKRLPVVGTETIQKVNFSIDGENALTGRLYIDLETAEVSEWGYYGQANNNVNLIDGNVVVADANDFYFTCMPATIAAGDTFTVEVTTDVATYTHSVTIPDEKAIEFKSGRVAEFGVNMASAQRVQNVGLSLPWSESFDSEDLSMYDITNGGGTTKVYPDDNLAGGVAKGEILIAKEGGSMTATFASDGEAKTLNLWFKSNKDYIKVSSTSDGVTITKLTAYGYTVALAEGVTTFKLTLSNENSNARVDDIVLTDKAPIVEKIAVAGATMSFIEGDEFVFNGTVSAIYQNGITEDVTENVVVDHSEVDMNTAGSYTVTVTYNGISTTYDITVQAASVETKTVALDTGVFADNTITWTQDDVTVVQAKGNATSVVNKNYNKASTMRLYQGQTLTFSSDYNITKIEMVTTGKYFGKTASVDVGTLNNPKTSGCTITWTGSAKKIVLTNGTGSGGEQIRTTSIKITYEVSGGGSETPETANQTL